MMSAEDDWSAAGDLGLGMGLKPGSLPKSSEFPVKTLLVRRRSSDCLRRRNVSFSGGTSSGFCDKRRVFLERRKSLVAAAELSDKSHGRGNSISSDSLQDVGDSKPNKSKLGGSFIDYLRNFKWKSAKKQGDASDKSLITEVDVLEAQETIATLQGKLEVYRELLYGKYKASEVLLNKLSECVQEHDQWRQKWKKENEDREKEINELQFKLMCTEGNLTDAQRVWLDRFNTLVKDNAELTSTVHEQSRLLRKLSLNKADLKRENEELLALQDAKERIAYRRSNSFGNSDDSYGPIELGILGACKCRSSNQDPCVCARSACNKHKLLVDTQNSLAELEEEKNELSRHCQLYREAFEEQLKRNKMLSKRLLVRDHSEPDLFWRSRKFSNLLRLRGKQANKNEAVDSLVDMVCDRTDALLQQEIMTKMLAQKVQDLKK